MLRRTSVVMTTTGASPLIAWSPVSSPTRSAPMARGEVVVLLVRQRLDRGGVEAPATVRQRQRDGVLGHHGLARPGRGGDQHDCARGPTPRSPHAGTRPGRTRGRTPRSDGSSVGCPSDALGLGRCLLATADHDPADEHGDLVEDVHRHGERREARSGSPLGVIAAAMMTITRAVWRRHDDSCFGRPTPIICSATSMHGEQEAGPERQHHEQRQAHELGAGRSGCRCPARRRAPGSSLPGSG